MSPARSRLAPRTCLAASLLALSASGCATLFGMDDASCSDCTAQQVLSTEPGPEGAELAAGGSGGAAAGAEVGDAQGGSPAVRLDPGRTPPSAVGSVRADPAQPDAGPDSGAAPEPDPCVRYCDAIMNTCLPGSGGVPDNLA